MSIQLEEIFETEIDMPHRQLWRKFERKQWMIALFFGSAALYASRLILPVSSFYISKELNWDRRSTGIVLGSFFYGYMITQVLGGYLADKYGGEQVLTKAAFVWALITLIFPYIPAISANNHFVFVLFLLSRVSLGVFQGFHYPSMGSLMAIRVKQSEKQFTYCVMSSGSHLGTLICGSLGSFLMEFYGWRMSFYFIGALSFLWAAFVSKYLLTKFIYNKQEINVIYEEEPEKFQVKEQLNRPSSPSCFDDIHNDVSNIFNWKMLIRHSAFWAMLFAHFTHSNCVVILISWLPSYFHDNYPDAKSWVFNVVPYLINIPSTLISGLIADYLIKNGYSMTFVRKLMTSIVLLGGAFCLLIMSTVSDYYSALFWMSIAICTCGFHCSGILLNPQDLGPKHGGSIYGIMSMFGAIPGFAGVYLVGYILDVTKSWSLVFQLTGGFCITGWIVYQIWGTADQII